MGKNVAPADYSTQIITPLVKLFANPDRGTRMALIDHMNEYADKLDKKTVTDKIWPNLVGIFLLCERCWRLIPPSHPANWVYRHCRRNP